MRDRFIETLTARAREDDKIMLVTGDLGFGVLTQFAADFPDQFLNAGVSEQNMTGMATGLALEGRVVFTYSIGNFPTFRCLEQIRNDAAYHDARVKVVSIGGGFSYGALGMSHHATEDLAVLRAIPQVEVVSPGCLWEVEQATHCLIDRPGTAFLRLDKSSAGDTSRLNDSFELGHPRCVKNGDSVTILTTGGILGEVLSATELLTKTGINCEVFSCHTLDPFEPAAVFDSIAKTGHLVVIEEHVVAGGLAGLISELCMESGVKVHGYARMGVRGGFCSVVGDQNYLRHANGLDAENIVKEVTSLVDGKKTYG